MWSNIFSPSKLTEIAVAVCRLQFIKNQQNYLKFNITVNFKYTRKVKHNLESSLDFQAFFDARYVIDQLSEIKDHIQVVS